MQQSMKTNVYDFMKKISPYSFWGIFIALTWFAFLRPIISWDLWIHLSQGRYLVENWKLPELETFTFSPIDPTVSVSDQHVLSEILLYLIYQAGGFYALQVFRVLMILSPIVFLLDIVKAKWKLWILLLVTMVAIGTMQKHLVKPPIFGLFFGSASIWLWIQFRYGNRKKLFYLSPILFWVWQLSDPSYRMGLLVLVVILWGECLDAIIKFAKVAVEKKSCSRPDFAIFKYGFSLLLVIMVSSLWVDPKMEILRQGVSSSGLVHCLDDGLRSNQNEGDHQKTLTAKERVMDFFRPMNNKDANLVAESQSPFNINYVLCLKVLFLLLGLYVVHFLALLSIKPSSFHFSNELPCLFVGYLSLGYIRVSHLPFLIMPILMVMTWQKMEDVSVSKKRAGILVIIMSSLVLLMSTSEVIRVFGELFWTGLGYTKWLLLGTFICALVTLSTISLTSIPRQKKIIPWVYVFFAMLVLGHGIAFVVKANMAILHGELHRVTGFLDTEVGLGKSNKFPENMANLVLKVVPDDEKIYNTYNMGGYLKWHWYGKRKIFIDGNSRIYDHDFYLAYINNNASDYIAKNNIRFAILNLVVDKDRLQLFYRMGWALRAYELGMVLLEKPQGPVGSSEYLNHCERIIPEYYNSNIKINDLDLFDRQSFAEFIHRTVMSMVSFGRLKDAHSFSEQTKSLVRDLNIPIHEKTIEDYRHYFNKLIKEFGLINHAAIGTFMEENNKAKGYRSMLIRGKTHFTLEQWGKAEQAFAQAIEQSKKENGDDVELMIMYIKTLIKNEKSHDAARVCQEALNTFPENVELKSLLLTMDSP
jgi:hypothetical protein